MVLGRFIYGLGGDSISATQWSVVIEFFHSNDEIGIATVLKKDDFLLSFFSL